VNANVVDQVYTIQCYEVSELTIKFLHKRVAACAALSNHIVTTELLHIKQ